MKGTILGVICCIACSVVIQDGALGMTNNPDQTVTIGENHQSDMLDICRALENIKPALESLETLNKALEAFVERHNAQVDEMLNIIRMQAVQLLRTRLENIELTLGNIFHALANYQQAPRDEVEKCKQNVADLIAALDQLDAVLVECQKLPTDFRSTREFKATVLKCRANLASYIYALLFAVGDSTIITTIPNVTNSVISVIDKSSENIKLTQNSKKKRKLFGRK